MTPLASSGLTDRFVGRAAELADLESMFTSTADAPFGVPPRLLTLTGVGGAGKTRLARELAVRVRVEFADGSVWLDLAPLSDPLVIAPALLAALDLQEQPAQPPVETLVAALAPRQLLVILDNCEHLLDAVRALCESLLSHCPELSILATSREALRLRGEIVYPVLPLALPKGVQSQDIFDADAVQLFVARAQEILPGFALTAQNREAVARVCIALDGLPLAIELAAARVNMMTVGEIAERLQDAFSLLTRSVAPNVPRHQTLRAAIDWSYDLLSENERALLRRTSIFAGGFTLEAVEQVCGEDTSGPRLPGQTIPQSEILDLLSNLVNKSLILVAERSEGSPTRYGMLETLRQYAREKLLAAGEETILGTRHLQWCVEFAERAEAELMGAEQGLWLARVDSELANFRVALRHAIEDNATWQGLRLANALFRYWDRRGKYSEAQGWYRQLLAGDLSQTPLRVRGRAMYRLAAMHYHLSQFDEAIRVAEAGLVVARELDDRRGMASILNLLGVMATDKGSFDRADEFYEQALNLYQELKDSRNISIMLNNFGNLARGRGHYRHALSYYESSLDLKREVGDTAGTAMGLNDVGAILFALGEYVRGQAVLEESLTIQRGLGSGRGMYLILTNMGRGALYLGDYDTAQTFLREAEQIGKELESKGDLAYELLSAGELAQAQGEYAHARSLYEKAFDLGREASEHFNIAQAQYHLATNALESDKVNAAEEYGTASLKLYREQEHKPGMAAGLEIMARVCAARQEYPRVAQFLGAAALLREQAETPPYPYERAALDKITTAARGALGERSYETALQRGRAAPLAETIADALALSSQPARGGTVQVPELPELRAVSLGQSVVFKRDEPLTQSDWTYTKSKELFFYLLSRQAASREEIGLDLWPDASPAQLRRIFHRVLGTLRKALGRNEWIAFENDKYAINRALTLSYDADLFMQYLAEARRALGAGRPRAIAPLQQAVELYHGDFMSDVPGGDWILFRREELRKEFLQALLLLGQFLSEQNEYARAAGAYERALAHDNYLEVAHRELMRALARQGEVGLALKQYQTLEELLRAEFGAKPAPETRALYERLRSGEST